jgi:hypothetical protein
MQTTIPIERSSDRDVATNARAAGVGAIATQGAAAGAAAARVVIVFGPAMGIAALLLFNGLTEPR